LLLVAEDAEEVVLTLTPAVDALVPSPSPEGVAGSPAPGRGDWGRACEAVAADPASVAFAAAFAAA